MTTCSTGLEDSGDVVHFFLDKAQVYIYPALRGYPCQKNTFNLICFLSYVASCDDAGCEHICVNDPLAGPICRCGEGFTLKDDGVSCQG